MADTLELELRDGGILILRLNRPERLNAINEEMLGELLVAIAEIDADDGIRVVVLTGAGRGFCSGIDMKDFGPSIPDVSAPVTERLRFQEAMASLPQCSGRSRSR